MEYSDEAIKLILSSRPFYKEVTKSWNDHFYIGHYHLLGVSNTFKSDHITKKEAKTLLKKDLKKITKQLNTHLTVELNQNQFDAVVSLVYDIGIKAFISDEIFELINKSNFTEASIRFRRFNKYMKKPVYQLIKSRKLEIELFNSEIKDET